MSIDKLSARDIMDLLPPNLGLVVKVLESVSSTNDCLLELIKTGQDNTNVLMSEVQTAGRGRQGNVWNSPPGNIYLSLHRQFKCELKELYGLSLVIGVGVARVLKSNGLHDVKLKWPNDVYWQSRKLAGILVETRQNGEYVDAVIGLGLNVQDQTSTQFVCLEDALQHKVYRNKLAAQLLVQLSTILQIFTESGFDQFKEEWNSFANSTSQLDSFAKQKIL